MTRPKALDLFCKAGGASMGLHLAGFDVTGVDIEPQKHYPFRFLQADALDVDLGGYDLIWASPPCQRYTSLRSVFDASRYADLMAPTRQRLLASGVPWIIENVPGAPMRADVMLCGAMFGLRSYRHRLFETSWSIALQPAHPRHVIRVNQKKTNRRAHWDTGGFVTVVGDIGSYVGPEAMGIDWMTGNELSQAVPPAYSLWLGRQAIHMISPERTAANA